MGDARFCRGGGASAARLGSRDFGAAPSPAVAISSAWPGVGDGSFTGRSPEPFSLGGVERVAPHCSKDESVRCDEMRVSRDPLCNSDVLQMIQR